MYDVKCVLFILYIKSRELRRFFIRYQELFFYILQLLHAVYIHEKNITKHKNQFTLNRLKILHGKTIIRLCSKAIENYNVLTRITFNGGLYAGTKRY